MMEGESQDHDQMPIPRKKRNILLKHSRMGKAPGVTPEVDTTPTRTHVARLLWRNTVQAGGLSKGRQRNGRWKDSS